VLGQGHEDPQQTNQLDQFHPVLNEKIQVITEQLKYNKVKNNHDLVKI
jgi:hypothetical protein